MTRQKLSQGKRDQKINGVATLVFYRKPKEIGKILFQKKHWFSFMKAKESLGV